MDEFDTAVAGRPVFKRTLRAVAALGLVAYACGTWLAGSIEIGPAGTVTVAGRMTDGDPVSTGSLGRNAASTRLDPCALPRR